MKPPLPDPDRLASWLAAHLPDATGPLTLTPFAGGQSNPTYRVTGPQGRWVMRTKPAPASRLLPSAHAIEREFRIMRALQGSWVPVPRTYVLCEDESVIGRAFYLMQEVVGQVWWNPMLPELAPEQRTRVYRAMVDVLADLHRLDVAALGMADFGRSGNYFERQIGRWTRQFLASVTTPNPDMDWLIDWLPQHLPPLAQTHEAPTIVHGDFRLDNLLFDPVTGQVKAVLDWELSTLGHPLADLSYHCLPWHVPSDVFRGMAEHDLRGTGIPSETEHMARYCDRSGRFQMDELQPQWPFFIAYNLFRLAAILQGIARRVEDGTASDAQARTAGAAARPMAALARQVIQGL